MNNKHALLIVVSLFATSSAGAQTWSLAGSWSTTSNPNGVWTYGEYSGGAFVPLTYDSANNAYDVGGSLSAGSYLYMNTGSTASYGIDPGQVSLDSDYGTAVARWTAPASGFYNITLNIGGNTAIEGAGYGNVFATFGGLNINLAGQTDTSFAGNIKNWTMNDEFMSAGTTVDAFVQYPGFADGGSTQTQFTIAAVPEPASYAALGLGVLGLIRRRRRK